VRNILISSVSKKVPLIQAVREASKRINPDCSIIGADLDPNCIGQYFVDSFWQMPATDKLKVEDLVRYCKKENIRFIIPTRDGELSFYAGHRDTLKEEGIDVMISSKQSIDLALDKFSFFQELEGVIPTYLACQELKAFPCVVKARYGAGSAAVRCNLNREDALAYGDRSRDLVFQPYIKGQEYSADLYVTREGAVHGVVCRERNVITHGESQISITVRDEEITSKCHSCAAKMNLYGHVMFQFIRETSTGKLFVLECNPRFGGASTTSIKAGLDSFFWFFTEAEGRPLPRFDRLSHEVKLVRSARDLFIDV